MLLGLRTTIYPTADLEGTKAWFAELLGTPPSFDEPFYVGFSVGGYELGLVPGATIGTSGTTYWGVEDCGAAVARLEAAGAQVHEAPRDVGDGIRVATVLEPAGNVLGVIENPHFALPDA